jgi:diacylglycerol kinase family enzyme
MALPYQRIVIIYNPNSTGAAPARARRLHARLKRRGVTGLELQETDYAGHGEQIAYAAAKKYRQPLLISVSGDGGYNEVINGAFRAMNEDASRRPVCTILPAGNANDHRRTVKKRPLVRAIVKSKPEAVDVLKLTVTSGKQTRLRYAHSYIGLGLSSEAAAELNRHALGRWKELKIVLRTLLHFDPFVIELPDGKHERLDSLVFANIHQMSKVMKLGTETNLHDGLFRVVAIPHRGRLQLLRVLLSIMTIGFKHPPQRSSYSFRLPKTELIHLDGEVSTIPGGSRLVVTAEHEALLTLR